MRTVPPPPAFASCIVRMHDGFWRRCVLIFRRGRAWLSHPFSAFNGFLALQHRPPRSHPLRGFQRLYGSGSHWFSGVQTLRGSGSHFSNGGQFGNGFRTLTLGFRFGVAAAFHRWFQCLDGCAFLFWCSGYLWLSH